MWVSVTTAVLAFLAAGCWFRAATVKVSREEAVAKAKATAAKKGQTPDLSGGSFDGWDFRETLSAQSRWNAWGAIAAGCAAIVQGLSALPFS